MKPLPKIGDTVHFVHGDRHVPATATGENTPDGQSLTVLPPNEPPFTTVAEQSAAYAPATWHWPEEDAPPKALTAKYAVQWEYSSNLGGPWAKGEVIELATDVAEAVNRDSPGVLVEEGAETRSLFGAPALRRYTVSSDYAGPSGGPWTAGEIVTLAPDAADALNRDNPGLLVAVEDESIPDARDRMVKRAKHRGLGEQSAIDKTTFKAVKDGD